MKFYNVSVIKCAPSFTYVFIIYEPGAKKKDNIACSLTTIQFGSFEA